MKRSIFMTMLVVGCFMSTFAQDTIMYIENEHGNGDYIFVCPNHYERVLVYAPNECPNFFWEIDGQRHYENPVIINAVPNDDVHIYYAAYEECDHAWSFDIHFHYCPVKTGQKFFEKIEI